MACAFCPSGMTGGTSNLLFCGTRSGTVAYYDMATTGRPATQALDEEESGTVTEEDTFLRDLLDGAIPDLAPSHAAGRWRMTERRARATLRSSLRGGDMTSMHDVRDDDGEADVASDAASTAPVHQHAVTRIQWPVAATTGPWSVSGEGRLCQWPVDTLKTPLRSIALRVPKSFAAAYGADALASALQARGMSRWPRAGASLSVTTLVPLTSSLGGEGGEGAGEGAARPPSAPGKSGEGGMGRFLVGTKSGPIFLGTTHRSATRDRGVLDTVFLGHKAPVTDLSLHPTLASRRRALRRWVSGRAAYATLLGLDPSAVASGGVTRAVAAFLDMAVPTSAMDDGISDQKTTADETADGVEDGGGDALVWEDGRFFLSAGMDYKTLLWLHLPAAKGPTHAALASLFEVAFHCYIAG